MPIEAVFYIIMVKFLIPLKNSDGYPLLQSYGALDWGYFHVKRRGFNFKFNQFRTKGEYEGRSGRSSLSNPIEETRRSTPLNKI